MCRARASESDNSLHATRDVRQPTAQDRGYAGRVKVGAVDDERVVSAGREVSEWGKEEKVK